MPILPVRMRALPAALTVFILILNAVQAQDNEVLDEIVAVVEDEIILRSDVNALVMGVIQQRQVAYSEQLWFDALGELVDQKVILAYAKNDTNVVVSAEQVNQELDQRIATLTAQVGGAQQLEQLYGKSSLEIRDEMQERVREQLMTQEFQRQQLANIKVTPSEVRQWFRQFPQDSLPQLPETVEVSHIVKFPEVDPLARQEALSIITTLRDSVLGSGSFEDLALQFSDDALSAREGGRIEDIRLNELVPEFAAVASSLEPGAISQVFETVYGYHVMRLNDRVGDIVDVNHILIRIDDTQVMPEEAIASLESLRDSIESESRSFALMAKLHSEEESSATRGGQVVNPQTGERDLPLEALGPSWQITLRALQEGEVSEPAEVELLDGRTAYHIVRLQKRTPAHQMNLDDDYVRIEQFALQAKQAEERARWLDQLRRDLYITVRVDQPEGAQTASR